MKLNLHTTNSEKTETKETKNAIAMYVLGILIILILIFAIITVLSINIQAMTQDESTENNNKIEEAVIEQEEEEKIMVVGRDDTIQEENETNTIVDTNEGANDQNSQSSTIYTASNGEQYTIIGRLNIPTLGIEYPILSSTSTALLKISINKYWGANPNEVGNMCVVGHNYRNTKFFSKLPNINIGDIVKITDLSGRELDYTVYNTYTADPDDTSCTSQLTNGHTEITLITCCNNNTERFVVKARAN